LSFPNIGNLSLFLEHALFTSHSFLLLFATIFSTASFSMDSVPIAYVPTLNERLDFLRKGSDTDILALVDSVSELRTCLPQACNDFQSRHPSEKHQAFQGSLSHVVPSIEIELNQKPPSVRWEQFGEQE
jgi:hypothetical protein